MGRSMGHRRGVQSLGWGEEMCVKIVRMFWERRQEVKEERHNVIGAHAHVFVSSWRLGLYLNALCLS